MTSSEPAPDPYGDDLFTEPVSDPDTLANLGPLAPMAGVWAGTGGRDVHPEADGPAADAFHERYELQPIDPQTNGPQLFYGLRYHVHVTRPGERETFHDQVGYWLWEPATETVTFTLGIPRGQVLLAGGRAAADATRFELQATAGSPTYGILANPFLDRGFHTRSYRIAVTVHPDGTWSYEEEALLDISGRDEPFAHTDGNTLVRIAPPTPNPLAGRSGPPGSLGIGSLAAEGRPTP